MTTTIAALYSGNVSCRTKVGAFVGLDGGSTSTKAVLFSESGDCCARPISFPKAIRSKTRSNCWNLSAGRWNRRVRLSKCLASAQPAMPRIFCATCFTPMWRCRNRSPHPVGAALLCDPHCIVDVGGQDIKIIVLHDGRIKDFRLNTQCSAGNGYFLQSTAEGLGIPIGKLRRDRLRGQSHARLRIWLRRLSAIRHRQLPASGLARRRNSGGLGRCFPKNIFLYVANVPNVGQLGTRFILQGGTQKNLAVVKAETTLSGPTSATQSRRARDHRPPHSAEAGAIGAAVEAMRLWQGGRRTNFHRTRCRAQTLPIAPPATKTPAAIFARTTVCEPSSMSTPAILPERVLPVSAKIPLYPGEQRMILATCEKGAVDDLNSMRGIKAGLDAIKSANPDLIDISGARSMEIPHPSPVADPLPRASWRKSAQSALPSSTIVRTYESEFRAY